MAVNRNRLRLIGDYLLVHTGLRWVCLLVLAAPIVPPMLASNLLHSSRGDATLMLHGGNTLVSMLLLQRPWLVEQWPLFAVVLVGIWAAKQLGMAVTWEVANSLLSPREKRTWVLALGRLRPFLVLSLITYGTTALLLYAFFHSLPLLGAILLRSLGEVGTDCVELGLLVLLLLVTLLGALLGEVTRAHLTRQRCSLRVAWSAATFTLRANFAPLALAALSRLLPAIAMSAGSLMWHLHAQQLEDGAAPLLASLLLSEAAAGVCTLLYFSWVTRALDYATLDLGSSDAPPERALS